MEEETKTGDIQLTRTKQQCILQYFEESKDPVTPEDCLEDVTNEIFEAATSLDGTQMLCRQDFNLFDTLACFEVMDAQQDIRANRQKALTPAKAVRDGILI